MTFSERRIAALRKCTEICNREYDKYLLVTQPARDEYEATMRQIDAEIDALSRQPLGQTVK